MRIRDEHSQNFYTPIPFVFLVERHRKHSKNFPTSVYQIGSAYSPHEAKALELFCLAIPPPETKLKVFTGALCQYSTVRKTSLTGPSRAKLLAALLL